MNNNTVSVAFNDDTLSIDDVIAALVGAGYAVPEYSASN